MSEKRNELRRELAALAGESQRYIQAKRRRTAAIRGVRVFLPLLVLVPALWLALAVVLTLATGGVSGGWPWWIVVLTLLLPAVAVLLGILLVSMQPVDRRDALAAIDRELGLEDRLVTEIGRAHV